MMKFGRIPAALPTGGGGIDSVEMFQGPDGLLHAVGCSTKPLHDIDTEDKCYHYVNGGPNEVGTTVGVQWCDFTPKTMDFIYTQNGTFYTQNDGC